MTDKIPEAELEVLACLDRLDSATARELREAMDASRPMAHGSMVTLLKRLEARNLVVRSKGPSGKAFVYRAAPESSAAVSRALARVRERVFDGDPVALVASLFEASAPDADQLDELQDLLDRLRDQEDDR